MSIICKLFGHKSLEGRHDGSEYMTCRPTSIDGTGRGHADLYYSCPRCGVAFKAGSTHRPQQWVESYLLQMSKADIAQLREALEVAKNGLEWYHDTFPATLNGCDDEAMEQIEAALKIKP